MFFSIVKKGKKKFLTFDEKQKRQFTITSKGSKANKQLIMKDRKRNVLYTLLPRNVSYKPQVQIFTGEECLLTCNCLNLFVDKELEFIFMGEMRYTLKSIETQSVDTITYILSDKNANKIGEILIKRNEKSERFYELNTENETYRDYMILFPLCIELSFYANETK